MTSISSDTVEDSNFIACAETVAVTAKRYVTEVDAESRFPVEAMAAIRDLKLLGMMIPREFGGHGCRAADVSDVCAVLGAACSSTAMIFAMHQIKVACIVRHSHGSAWLEDFQRRIAAEQLLLASSTTEGNKGGAVRSSEAPIERDGAKIRLVRDASVISYGANADAIVTTARSSGAAENSDQALIVFERSDYTLEPTKTWDTLGMRGTCSIGYLMKAEGIADQVLPEPYDRIHNQTMAPYAHMFWSSVWYGIASGAFARGRAFLRQASRSSGGQMPPGAPNLARARISLETLRAAIQAGMVNFERHLGEPGGLTSMDAELAMNFLKVESSELALQTVMGVMRTCGLAGYRNDSEFSIGRAVRDVLSAPVMIHNDRILADAGASVLLSSPPLALSR
jgi:acyl-CoA dehydrogenase